MPPGWDLVVVGAGPAGSAAALSALRSRPGCRVALVDAAAFPRDKACGDAVASPALDLLADLGVTGAHDGHGPVDGVRLTLPSGGPVAQGRLDQPAHVVPRRVLDDRLRTAALAAGAEPVRLRVRRVTRHADGVVVEGSPPGVSAGQLLDARVVIGADGVTSTVRRQAGVAAHPRPQTALALRAYAEVPHLAEDVQLVELDPAAWPAYTWVFPLADGSGRANVGWGTLVGRGLPRERYARALREGLERIAPGAVVDEATVRGALLPLTPGRARQPDGRVLLTGDALGLVNPLTGEGILYAVVSGALAGSAAVGPGDPGGAYRRALRVALGRHLRATGVTATALRAPGVLEAGVRAAAADPRVLADLLRLGLVDGLLTPRIVTGLLRHLLPGHPDGGQARRPSLPKKPG